jgi:hypothetical protein
VKSDRSPANRAGSRCANNRFYKFTLDEIQKAVLPFRMIPTKGSSALAISSPFSRLAPLFYPELRRACSQTLKSFVFSIIQTLSENTGMAGNASTSNP